MSALRLLCRNTTTGGSLSGVTMTVSSLIDEMSIPDVKIVRLNGTNSFKVKKLIAVDEPSENILLYKP